jgi:hypothetical protein
MKTQHTPGPWATSRDAVPASHVQITVYAESTGNRVATVFDREANANLIAAGPDLLSALEECLAWFDLDPQRNHPIMAQDTDIGFRMIRQARTAVDKAKGQS